VSAERIEAARQLHRSGQLAQAIAAYREVLEAEPQRAEVWHLKGVAEHQSGELEAARESAARAIALGGERPAFLLLEGGVMHDRGELLPAQQRFARLVAAKPDWPQGHLELGLVHVDLGRPDLARAELERAATDCQTLLGENHPDTIALRADLALLSRESLGSLETSDS